MSCNRQLEKYLRRRAVAAPWRLDGCARGDFAAAVVIPALAEAQALPRTLNALAANPVAELARTLVVVVVNNRADASDALRQENAETLAWLQGIPFPQLNLAWVDASSAGFELPSGDGVGLARKIGFDLALPRLAWTDNPLLISLDADTLVAADYLPAIFAHFAQSPKGGAAIPFCHQAGATAAQEAAIRRYELYLRSYLFGLQQAGSPYAYHTIGSAFCCTAAAYLKAGGMNRRQAAEDFYFLQQLAKVAGIAMLGGTLVRPSARVSSRVPFGTGRAVQQLEGGQGALEFISAAGFSVLRSWLELVADGWQQPAELLLEQAAALHPQLGEFLRQLDFAGNWQKLQLNCRRKVQFQDAFAGWFDALRTRQLLSRLQEEVAEPKDLELVAELLAWGGFPGVVTERPQLQLLERLQGAG